MLMPSGDNLLIFMTGVLPMAESMLSNGRDIDESFLCAARIVCKYSHKNLLITKCKTAGEHQQVRDRHGMLETVLLHI